MEKKTVRSTSQQLVNHITITLHENIHSEQSHNKLSLVKSLFYSLGPQLIF